MTDNDMLNELYRQKYLKYKAKYLELRDQSGGVDLPSDDVDDNEIRFQNCAILQLSIRNNGQNVYLDLIYSGEVNDDRKYYISMFDEKIANMKSEINNKILELKRERDTIIQNKNVKKNYILCTHNTRLRCFLDTYFIFINTEEEINISGNRIVFNTRKVKNVNTLFGEINTNIEDTNIYIIRHGEGTHNIKKGIRKLTKVFNDTLLTPVGITQTENAGNFFSNFLKVNYIQTLNKLFASKLKRTRQTLSILLSNVTKPKEIIILPCSHELTKFKSKTNCDELNEGKPIAFENRSNCICGKTDTMSCLNTIKQQDQCKSEYGYTINWDYFNSFYDQPNNKCRKTNMIQLLLGFINRT